MQTARSRQTGTLRSVGRAAEFDLDDADGEWVTSCDTHSTLINSETRDLAARTQPLDFCDYCRRVAGQDFGEYTNGLLDADLAEMAGEVLPDLGYEVSA